ncbi:unnamed protein product, partial [Rotaria sp. Silwood2]
SCGAVTKVRLSELTPTFSTYSCIAKKKRFSYILLFLIGYIKNLILCIVLTTSSWHATVSISDVLAYKINFDIITERSLNRPCLLKYIFKPLAQKPILIPAPNKTYVGHTRHE